MTSNALPFRSATKAGMLFLSWVIPAFGEAPDSPVWEEGRAHQFRIISSAGEADHDAVRLTAEFTYREVYETFKGLGLEISAPPEPLTIFLFDNPELMMAELRRAGLHQSPVSAFYDQRSNAVYALGSDSSRLTCGSARTSAETIDCERRVTAGALLVRRHEIAHLVMYNIGVLTRGSPYPAWITEGLACLFEADPWMPHDDNDRDRPINRFRLEDVGPLNQMFRIDELIANQRPWENTPAAAAQNYAQAWALVHFLYHRYRPGFATYLRHLSRRRPDDPMTPEAESRQFEAAFGPVDESLEKEWRDYVTEFIARTDPSCPGAPG